MAEIAQDSFKRNRCLWHVPGPPDGRLRGGAMAGLCVPQQDQVLEREDQGGSSLGGLGATVLRVFQAEKLLQAAKIRHFRFDHCRLPITAASGSPQSGALRTCLAWSGSKWHRNIRWRLGKSQVFPVGSSPKRLPDRCRALCEVAGNVCSYLRRPMTNP